MGCAEGRSPGACPEPAEGVPSDINSSPFLARNGLGGWSKGFFSTLLGSPYERDGRVQIAIVGLPQSGKTTVFNAVTRGRAEVAAFGSGQRKPNVGVAKVPETRLARLSEIFGPKRATPAEMTYVDIPPGPVEPGRGPGIGGEHLNELQRTDALLIVARSFEDPAVGHPGDGVDALWDVETMLLEVSFADLEILQRRLARLDEGLKGAKSAERESLNRERALLERLSSDLEEGTAVREQTFSSEEGRHLEGFNLLTSKHLIIVVNAGEGQMSEAGVMEASLSSRFEGPRVGTAVLCGKLEMELSQMEPAEERDFRESLGVGESGLARMINLSHDVADMITFFTGNPNEVRAWTVPRGTTASKAAGKVHSDMERGFIRAEVVSFEELDAGGSVAEARKRGVLRQEGSGYLVQDGDVLNVLFNV